MIEKNRSKRITGDPGMGKRNRKRFAWTEKERVNIMDRINDKHIQEKDHRADCRKKQQGTRIKVALLAGLAGAVLANTFPGQIRKRNRKYDINNRSRTYLPTCRS